MGSVVLSGNGGGLGLRRSERDLLRAVCLGGTARAAADFGLSRSAVKHRLSPVYARLGIDRRGQGKLGAACYLLGANDREKGLVPPCPTSGSSPPR